MSPPSVRLIIADTPTTMGSLYSGRGRSRLSPLNTPNCSPALQQQSTLLDQFSQEIGSASSASSCVIPDVINRHVKEHPHSASASQCPASSIDNFEVAPLRLRGGNIVDFEECDPNSPTTLQRYQNWIDQDYYDEKFSLRQASQGNPQSTRQVSSPIELWINPHVTRGSPQQFPTQYPTNVRPNPQAFRSPSSVDDSSDDEEVDEIALYGCTFIIGLDSDSESGSDAEENSDSEDDISSRSSSRGGGVSLRYPNTPRLPVTSSPTGSFDSLDFYERDIIYCGSDSDEYEEIEDNCVCVQGSHSDEESAHNYISLVQSNGESTDDPEHDADIEGDDEDEFQVNRTMWNSNVAILQHPNSSEALIEDLFRTTLTRYVTQSDFEEILMEVNYPEADTSADQDSDPQLQPALRAMRTLIERSLIIFNTELSLTSADLFSPPSSIYNDDASSQQHGGVRVDAIPFSPFSPAAPYPFTFEFPWSRALDIHACLQCPPEFNYSWVSHDVETSSSSVSIIPAHPSKQKHMLRMQSLAPSIFDWAAFSGCLYLGVITCYVPPLCKLRFAFGNGSRDGFPFTFAHNEPSFPSKVCLCRQDVRC